jgi:peptidyl-prolyl cis-trans isomerase A (cyclophilin A)/peptidyl-prolyl cis-trans isomerase B (cyclophilin B)
LRFLIITGIGLSMAFQAVAAEAPVQVVLQTTQGDITLELDAQKAPKTVENFLKYVDEGFYTDTIFHRVIAGFMAQGGGFDTKFNRKTTHAPVINEADNGLGNEVGTIAMARTSDPHSGSSQFFINVNNNSFLNHTGKNPRGWGYCVFGKVIKGMEIVKKIEAIPTGRGGPFPKDVPQEMVVIKSAKRVAKATK